MIQQSTSSNFPDQTASSSEKSSMEFGEKVAKAIEYEWFRGDMSGGTGRYGSNWSSFNSLRLYARGQQPVEKYKNELATNGDLSYLNLDWKPVPVLSKFVDIVVNGMTDSGYKIKSFAVDPFSVQQRTEYADALAEDALAGDLMADMQETMGVDMSRTGIPKEELPETPEEIQLKMQLEYKQPKELAQEMVIGNVLAYNKYKEVEKRLAYDLVTIGICCDKTEFNLAEGIRTKYVDPANLVYSYTEDPNFEDLYYVGEVREIHVNELKKQFPELTKEEVVDIVSNNSGSR